MGYDIDADSLEKDCGGLSMLRMESLDITENISFNFHNYGASLELSNNIELRDIYKLFSEILSSCFGYVVKLSDTYDDVKYVWFYDEDGKSYQLQKDRSDYFRNFQEMVNAKDEITIAKETLFKTKQKLGMISKKQNDNKNKI